MGQCPILNVAKRKEEQLYNIVIYRAITLQKEKNKQKEKF